VRHVSNPDCRFEKGEKDAPPTPSTDGGCREVRIAWVESACLQAGAGHGVDFFAGEAPSVDGLVAVLRGFEWLRGNPDTVDIEIRPPSADFDADSLSDMKTSIEHYVTHPGLFRLDAQLSPTLWARANA